MSDSFCERPAGLRAPQHQQLKPIQPQRPCKLAQGEGRSSETVRKMAQRHQADGVQPVKRDSPVTAHRPRTQPVSVCHGADQPRPAVELQRFKFCKGTEHYLSRHYSNVKHKPQRGELHLKE